MAQINKSPIIISIEGNIGSGKSTFVNHLKQYYSTKSNHNLNICFLQEPVDEWNSIRDKNGVTMLSKFYADSKTYAFPFQMMAYISRLALLRDALRKSYDMIITERCVQTDKMVFAQMLYDDNKMEDIEYTIYNRWFDEFIKDIPKIATIYLKTDPEVAKKRVDKRGRSGETIPLEYLAACHRYHEQWLLAKPEHTIKMIDVNQNVDSNTDAISEWVNSANKFIIGLRLSTNSTNIAQHTYILMFDGGSRGNPGICGAGHVIMLNGEQVSSGSTIVSTNNTNNYAEYMSLINGLNDAYDNGIRCIHVHGDSQLVINQVLGKWQVQNIHLKNLHAEVIDKLTLFDEFSFLHVPREHNKLADAEANKAMDNYEKHTNDI